MPIKQPDELTPEQITAITQLLSGASYTDAANAAGVNISTLRRWRREYPLFAQELRARKSEILSQTASKIADNADKSIDTLVEVRDDKTEDGSVRVRAASKILDLSLQTAEIEVLQNEIDDLKARLDAAGK